MKFRTSGDLGDCVYKLGVIRRFAGGSHRLCLVDRNLVPPRTNLLTFRAEVIAPLIRAQPYIESCECSEEAVDLDLSHFRPHYSRSHSLMWSQFEYAKVRFPELQMDRGREAWLSATPDLDYMGRVIIARSPRYNNAAMPWAEIVKKYGERILFVGIDAEYHNFCSAYGNVERLVLENYLKLAQVLMGAELFIGNQSSPFAVAEGLKVRRILEVCLSNCDCIYQGGDVQHVTDGTVKLPNLDGTEGFTELGNEIGDIDEHTVPRGGWQFPNLPPNNFFDLQVIQIKRELGVTHEEARRKLIEYSVKRLPDYFKKGSDGGYFKQALANSLL